MSERTERIAALQRTAAERILVLDGSWGAKIQELALAEEEFRGERFAATPASTRQHRPALPQLPGRGARAARRLPGRRRRHHLDEHLHRDARSRRPTTAPRISSPRSTSPRAARARGRGPLQRAPIPAASALGGGLDRPDQPHALALRRRRRPGARAVDFDELYAAYREQAIALHEGGVDIFLVETIFDTLNAKAALKAILDLRDEGIAELPIWISGTITDLSGRTLSGQTVEAFWTSVRHAEPFAVGLNCALGADLHAPLLAELAGVADTLVSAYPNAGLPNEFGEYDERPGAHLRAAARVGAGRAGQRRRRLLRYDAGAHPGDRRRCARARPRARCPRSARRCASPVSSLSPPRAPTPAATSAQHSSTSASAPTSRAPRASSGSCSPATMPARSRSRASRSSGGAQIIDVNMDDGLLDGEQAMTTFLRLIASEPDIARVPVMIDSSKWSVIEAGLKCVQGKAIVNSISLKEGEQPFLEQARTIRRYGAAVVVMAFDEDGQADTVARKVSICERAYDLLTQHAGFDAEDLIFDPNIFAIATGHARARRLRGRVHRGDLADQGAPAGRAGVRRPLECVLRLPRQRARAQAMHSVFLYHAIAAGPGHGDRQRRPARDLRRDRARPARTRRGRRPQPPPRRHRAPARDRRALPRRRRRRAPSRISRGGERPVRDRLVHALVNGINEFIVEDTEEARLAASGRSTSSRGR